MIARSEDGRPRRPRFPAACRAVVLAVLLLCVAAPTQAQDAVTVGVLKFGTVNWELDVVKTRELDTKHGFALELLPLASKNATSVALQAGEADIIVTDWVWVARQRAEGQGYTFAPYSVALGAIMVPADSPVQSIADLKDRRLGIAGGALDKSWLLLRAAATETADLDLDSSADKVFAAPPLLNEQILSGRLDAVLNYWHYAARLEAAGLRRLVGVHDIARTLGIERPVPLVGYVFDDGWAAQHGEQVAGFLRATREAKDILAKSDAEWERLRPLMKAADDATFIALRDRYREGIPRDWGAAEQADARRLYAVLAKLGGKRLVGRASELPEGTFWAGAGD